MRKVRILLRLVVCLLIGAGALHGMDKGSLDAPEPGWYLAGAELEATANPAEFFYAVWHGDDEDATIEGDVFPFTVDRARNVVVEFKPHVTEQYRIPWWWLAQFDADSGGWDAQAFEDMVLTTLEDGAAPVWRAYLTGTDPQDPNSRFAISEVAFAADGKVQLRWSHAAHVDPDLPPVIIEFRENLLEGDWDAVGQMQMQEEMVWEHDGNGDVRGYYRLRADTP